MPRLSLLHSLHRSDPAAEYAALRHTAGLWEATLLGLLRIEGSDRTAFLHNLLTNDIKRLAPGAGCRAGLVTPAAKLLADVIVLAEPAAHWLITDASRLEVVRSTLERFRITEDVRLEDATAQTVILGLFGPAAASIAEQMGRGQLQAMPYAHSRIRMEDVPLHLIRVEIFGIPGALLAAQAEQAAWLWDTLLERARARGLRPVGWEALNIVRIEAGCPWYGLDMDEANLLPETGLETVAVSDSKGCYVGQEVIARLSTYGSVSRKLMGVRCEGTAIPERGDVIAKDGEPLGSITSACYSPTLTQPIALGYVKRPHYNTGTAVKIQHGAATIDATLATLPLLPHTSPQSTDHSPQKK